MTSICDDSTAEEITPAKFLEDVGAVIEIALPEDHGEAIIVICKAVTTGPTRFRRYCLWTR